MCPRREGHPVQWNNRGLKPNRNELLMLITSSDTAVIRIQET